MSETVTIRELQSLVERFEGLQLSVVGDLILDHYIWGDVSRISPEAPVVVVNVNKEELSLGGAANVAKNIVSLGAQASVVGVIGTDRFGEQLTDLFAESGIGTDFLVEVEDRSTTVKSRVLARSQQVVRVDRESSELLSDQVQKVLSNRIDQAIEVSSGIVVSDYAKGVISPTTYAPFSRHYREGVFHAQGRPLVVDPKNANFDLYLGATVIKPNRLEAEAASGMRIRSKEDAVQAARVLLERWQCEQVLITLGEMGMVAVERDKAAQPICVPTEALEVYDVSGAGDTVAAVFCLALSAGGSVLQAAQLSNIAAGVVVAEIGAVAITEEELQSAILRAQGI